MLEYMTVRETIEVSVFVTWLTICGIGIAWGLETMFKDIFGTDKDQ